MHSFSASTTLPYQTLPRGSEFQKIKGNYNKTEKPLRSIERGYQSQNTQFYHTDETK